MKKAILFLLIISIIFLFVSCKNAEEKENRSDISQSSDSSTGESRPASGGIIPDSHVFTGEILSVEKGMILVSPDELNSAISPQVFVNVSQFSDIEFKKGERVRVVFNGQVAQSYPPQILGVISITKE